MTKTKKPISHSPLPESTMTFYKAFEQLGAGKKINRKSWPEGEYGVLQDGRVKIVRNGTHDWIISDGDIAGDDWTAN